MQDLRRVLLQPAGFPLTTRTRASNPNKLRLLQPFQAAHGKLGPHPHDY